MRGSSVLPVPTMLIVWSCTLLFILADATTLETPTAMRASKCAVRNGTELSTRATLFQQCLTKNYGEGNETHCYPELGCFLTDYPWTSLLRPFPPPLHPAEINTKIYCFTRASPKRYNVTLWPQVDLGDCPFDHNRTSVFITHGFVQNGNLTWLSNMKNNYLKSVDANVFLVDWGQGATLVSYLQVSSNTRVVGAEIARFIKFLEGKPALNVADVHLIGHSLGGQVVAYAAKLVPGISHLTALEPAQPGFEGEDKRVRLDKTDAVFVEVVHTNAQPFIPKLGFGMIFPHGDADFYVNGGKKQPGCPLPANRPEIKSIKDLALIPAEVVYQWVFCSHTRAYEYYSRALNHSCMIWGRSESFAKQLFIGDSVGLVESVLSKNKKCDTDTCLPMGLLSRLYKARGTFAATTHVLPPFCETDPEKNAKILSDVNESIRKYVKLGILKNITEEDLVPK